MVMVLSGHRPALPLEGRVLLFVVTLLFVLRGVVPDLTIDRAALLAFRAAVGPHLPWNTSAASPCAWRGVRCSPGNDGGDRVISVKLPGASLSGRIPAGTVGNLTALRTLSLRLNAISREIPPDIGNCAAMRYLYLQGNKLTSDIPEGLFSLELLMRLDLSRNHLGGGISPEFNKLRRLATLYLENNDLNGTLPAELNLPKLQLFNVSYNQLTGPVPASLAGRPARAFLGMGLCGGPLPHCNNSAPPSPAVAEYSKSSKLSSGAIAGIVAGAVVAFLLALTVVFFICCRGRRTKADRSAEATPDIHEDSPVTVTVARADKDAVKQPRSPPPPPPPVSSDGKKLVFVGRAPDPPYDLEALLHASAEVLGKGSFGTTYRATLEGGLVVLAVKRLRSVNLPEQEFRDKVSVLGALRHDNLPPLRAYFYSKEEKLLVYDFVGAGSLSSLLHGNNGADRGRLDFTARARIALAAARGTAFIHGVDADSTHGNIKSSNVLVTNAHDGAYVADYGLVQLVRAAALPKRITGYRAPEVTDERSVSQKADVYSFGVLLLELLTGKAPTNTLLDGEGTDLPQWARSVVQEEWTTEVFDASIANDARVEEEMMRLLRLGLDCTEQHPDRRPAMSAVAAMIQSIVEDACQESHTSNDGRQSVSA